MVWKETCWTMSMLLQRGERTKEERAAWRLQKRKIVKSGTTLLRWLFIIDIALFALYAIAPRIPFNFNAYLARQVARERSIGRQYADNIDELGGYSEADDASLFDLYNDNYRSTYGDDSDIGKEKDAQQGADYSDDNGSGERDEHCRRSQASYSKKNDCPSTEACTEGCSCKCPGCKSAAQSDTEKATSHKTSTEHTHKKSEQRRRSKRLTGTCKERNVLRRHIPRNARARYFIEHIYKPMDADSMFRQTPCATPSCRWLQSLLNSGGSQRREAANRNRPCTNFYRHVCEAKTWSPYKIGSDKLMDSMRRIISRHKTQDGALPANSDSLFKRCMEGVDLMIKDHIRYDWDEKKLDGCTSNFPKTPLTLSERFFKSGRRRTMPEFFDYIKSLTNNLSLDDSTEPASGFFTREWIPAACQWVARAARCHYAIDLAMESGEHLDRYQLYWKVIYFSPLLGPMANRIFEAVFDEPPKARVQACFNLMEDHYITNTTKTARLALKQAVRRPHDILSKVSWLLRWALRDRVPRWLSRRNRQGSS
ncbi:hypothetical protein MRX96_055468 [Rhipicephalus microplus]